LQSHIGFVRSQVRELMAEHEEDRNYLHDKIALLEHKAQNTLDSIELLRKQVVSTTTEVQPKPSAKKSVDVAVLIVLKASENGTEYTILVVERTSPAFADLPTGSFEGGEFVGEIPLLLEKVSTITIRESALVDLTQTALHENPDYRESASPKKFTHIRLWHQEDSLAAIFEIKDRFVAHQKKNEANHFQLVEMHDVLKHTPNLAALAAVHMYQSLLPKLHLK